MSQQEREWETVAEILEASVDSCIRRSAIDSPRGCLDCRIDTASSGGHDHGELHMKVVKNRICLWYDGDAEEAAQFYAKTFPDSSVGAVYTAPGDFPSGKKGDVLTVESVVFGISC